MARIEIMKSEIGTISSVRVRGCVHTKSVTLKVARYLKSDEEWATCCPDCVEFFTYELIEENDEGNTSYAVKKGSAHCFMYVQNVVFHALKNFTEALKDDVDFWCAPDDVDEYRERFDYACCYGMVSDKVNSSTFDDLLKGATTRF